MSGDSAGRHASGTAAERARVHLRHGRHAGARRPGQPRAAAAARRDPMLSTGRRSRGLPYVVFTNGTNRTPAHFARVLRDDGPGRPRRPHDDAGVERRRHVREARLPAGHGARGLRADRAAARGRASRSCRPSRRRHPTQSRAGAPAVDAVFVGWFREFTMYHLEAACQAVWSGAALYSASETPFFAVAGGRALGTSRAISAMIRSITGCSADDHRQAVARRAARRRHPARRASAAPRRRRRRSAARGPDGAPRPRPRGRRRHRARPARRLRSPAAARSRTCTCAGSTSCSRSAGRVRHDHPERTRGFAGHVPRIGAGNTARPSGDEPGHRALS